jgi:hypothetical protein
MVLMCQHGSHVQTLSLPILFLVMGHEPTMSIDGNSALALCADVGATEAAMVRIAMDGRDVEQPLAET